MANTLSSIAYFEILLPLALILLCTKFFSLVGKKLGLPQVVGMLIAGLLLGLIKLIPNQMIFTSQTLEGLSFLAKIGVILLMFSAGIETDIKQFKKCGVPSVIITLGGVIFPLVFGFLVAAAFNGGFKHMTPHMLIVDFFYGSILAATSVSVTVAALKELGKLNSKVGTSIIEAAILDDIIGVIILSLLLSLNNGSGAGKEVGIVLGKMVGFFAAAAVLGIAIHFLFNFIEKRHPHTRRLPIIGFATCFFLAYAAEKWFGIADITGAYVAGIILSTVHEHEYIDRKIEISSYMIFVPVFFANIGITADFSGIDARMAGFGFAFIAAGLLGKVIGCSIGALSCRYSLKDSLRVGVGMMVRAEVVLVCAQRGIDGGLVDPSIMPFVLILIILSALLAPLILKISYRKESPQTAALLSPLAPANADALPSPSGCAEQRPQPSLSAQPCDDNNDAPATAENDNLNASTETTENDGQSYSPEITKYDNLNDSPSTADNAESRDNSPIPTNNGDLNDSIETTENGSQSDFSETTINNNLND